VKAGGVCVVGMRSSENSSRKEAVTVVAGTGGYLGVACATASALL
jgi:hypothetical protein